MRKLKILLSRNNEKKVDLTFPAQSALWISELIPDSISQKIAAHGICLQSIQDDLKTNGIEHKRDILLYSENEMNLKIWLD